MTSAERFRKVMELTHLNLKGRDYRCRIFENRQLHDLAILQLEEMNLADLEENAGRSDASAFGQHGRDGVVLCDELVRL
jgi:hypothetical protein